MYGGHSNYRNSVFPEQNLFSGSNIMRTPIGNVRTTQNINLNPPPLPPPPLLNQRFNLQNNNYPLDYGNYGFGNYNGYNHGYGGYNGYGGGFNSFNHFGNSYLNQNDPENTFIQLAEESSRSAFQSIAALVGAIGNIASLLDSTFFAMTSSFRAILGVTANFGKLRGIFVQLWSAFSIFRGLTWIYRKFLYMLRLSNIDPSNIKFNEAFESAATFDIDQKIINETKPTPWPVIAFMSFIFTAPYLVMKLFGNIENTAIKKSLNPTTWVNPISAQAQFDFQARNPQELSIRTGQIVFVAPKEIQATNKLLNSGWVLATLDKKTSGLIPTSYVRNSTRSNINNISTTTTSVPLLKENSDETKEPFIIENIEKPLTTIKSTDNFNNKKEEL